MKRSGTVRNHVSQPRSSVSRSPTPETAPIQETASGSLSRIRTSLTGGSPLPPTTRQRMEAGFGGSFADVRIHTGGAASAATRELQADALTSGSDIAFAPSAFRPGTSKGDRLIAHELAHVVQQRRAGSGGAVQAKSLVSCPDDTAEHTADRAADTVLAGGRASIPTGGLSLRGRILRRARLGASSIARSPALTQAPSRAPAPGAGPLLTTAMTSNVSPAGGQLTGLERRDGRGRGEPSAKAPDEAQTARGETPGEATTPKSVMIAGLPAGSAEGAALQAAPKKDREKDRRKKREEKREEKKEPDQQGAPGAGGSGGAKLRARKFGQNLGDRGAVAAAAARQRLDERAVAMQVTEGAATRINAARAAAEPPPTASQADGQRQHVGALATVEVQAPDAAAASTRAQTTLESAAPGTIEELDNFASAGGAGVRGRIAQSIAAEAEQQAAPVQRSMSAISSPPQGVTSPPAVPQPDSMPAPASPSPNLASAAPPPVPEASLDASEFRADADEALAVHDVDDATLEKAEEGPLRAVGNNKRDLNSKIENAAERARGRESIARAAAGAELANADSEAVGGMAGEREAGQARVGATQDATRTGEEAGERTLAEQITSTYQTAEQTVTDRLGSLQDNAVQSFRERQAEVLESFSSGVRADLNAFKERRYSGASGLYYRARDWALSINSMPEVQALYQRHRNQYIITIDQLLSSIKAGIEDTIAACRRTLEDARRRIDELVAANEGQLDADAREAVSAAQARFRAMEARIDQTRQSALSALDRERERAITEMDRALEEIRAENAGLVDRVANAIRALAEALGRFMALMARITRMGIGAFLGAALSQAKEGVQNNLWDQLKEAFKEWLFMKLPVLQVLLNLPPNWYEMLTALATNMIGLFIENIPAMLPAIGTAAMIWLATTLAAKLIPGVGAIMAVIDAIRGAWALVQSLFSAAQAFFEFVMRVANRGNGAVAFARALAFGIVAAVDAILTFLGVDRLIRRVIGAIARPFGRIIRRLQTRFSNFMARRRQRRRTSRDRDRAARQRDGGRDSPDASAARRRAADRGRADRRNRDRAEAQANRGRDRRNERRESPAERRRRQQQERERRRRERLDRAVPSIRRSVTASLRDGVSERRLRIKLMMLRIRHRLRVLRLLPSGAIEAANSPLRIVVRARKLQPRALGRLIQPILARAEARYNAQLVNDQEVASAADRMRAGGSPDPSGQLLSRGQRAEVMRQAPVATGRRGDFGSGVSGRQSTSYGNPQSQSFTMLDIPGAAGEAYPAIASALVQLRASTGLSSAQVSAILAAPRSQQTNMMAVLNLTSSQQELLQGVTALDTLERARQGDVGTANLVARRLGAVGEANLSEQFGDPRAQIGERSVTLRGRVDPSDPRAGGAQRAGALAPATMVGAISRERREQRRRIGNIFRRLLQASQRANIYQEGSGNLGQLAQAVERWLNSKNPVDLSSAEAGALIAELVVLLESYD